MTYCPHLSPNAARYVLYAEQVGSRVTCNPPPTDTDEDWLILARHNDVALLGRTVMSAERAGFGHLLMFGDALDHEGWQIGGSVIKDGTTSFHSYTRGGVNLIVTADKMFHIRFRVATSVAKHLNLMDKRDRIILFQAVLYGHDAVGEQMRKAA